MIIEALSKAMDMMPRTGHKSAFNLARRLGWFSIGLGLLELAAPHRIAGLIGRRDAEPVIALYGLREVATGAAAVAARNPAPVMWGRVGGDGLDILSLLAAAPASRRKLSLGLVLAGVSLITAVDLICAQTLSADIRRARMGSPDYSDRTGFPKAGRTLAEPVRERTPMRVAGAVAS
jgi:hypothetical protein